MEHIVQFAIGIDDKAIIDRVTARAEDIILEEIKNDAKTAIFERNHYSSSFTGNPTRFFEEKIELFMKENKDEIIEITAKRLAERLSRTKAAKAVLEGMKND